MTIKILKMETKICKFDLSTHDVGLSKDDLLKINGGGFAYDIAFLIRESIKYIANGCGGTGHNAVAVDLALNYKPLN